MRSRRGAGCHAACRDAAQPLPETRIEGYHRSAPSHGARAVRFAVLGNVLCEAPDQRSVLAALDALLKDGAYVFFEHVRHSVGWKGALQDFWRPGGVCCWTAQHQSMHNGRSASNVSGLGDTSVSQPLHTAMHGRVAPVWRLTAQFRVAHTVMYATDPSLAFCRTARLVFAPVPFCTCPVGFWRRAWAVCGRSGCGAPRHREELSFTFTQALVTVGRSDNKGIGADKKGLRRNRGS